MYKSVHGGDVYRNKVELDFSANINPFGTPSKVVEAMVDSLKDCGNYPDVYCTKLVEAIGKFESVPSDTVLCGNGAAEIIFSSVLAIKPRKALVQAPTFAEYEQALGVVGCQIEYYQSKKENEFEVKSDILEKIDDDLDMLFLCNPNNPTGMLIDSNLLNEIATKCKEKNVYFVIDECFQDFISENISFKSNLVDFHNVIILKAFTKIYALAGIRLGFCICYNKDLLSKMKECVQPWSVSIVAQSAGVSALKETDFVKKTVDFINHEREFVKAELSKIGYKVYDSKVNYVFFEANSDLYQKCLEKGVLIRSCANYVGLDENYFRIAVKSHENNLKLIETMREIEEER